VPFRGWVVAPLCSKTLAHVIVLPLVMRKQIPEALQGSHHQLFGGRRRLALPGVEPSKDTIQLVKCLIRWCRKSMRCCAPVDPALQKARLIDYS
jgi:hypothetical protein